MNGFPVTEIVIIFVLILANSLFAASEIAIVSARRSRLQQQVDAGKESARQAMELAEHPEHFLATVQVGMTLISTLASVFGGASISAYIASWIDTIPTLAPYGDALSLGAVVVLITYFSLVIGELTPKRLALQSAEGIAVRVAPLMTALAVFTRPIVVFLTGSATLVLRLLGRADTRKEAVTAEDIVYLAREGAVSGTVESEEEQFIQRVFRFTDKNVNSIMIPRTEIVAVEIGTSLEQVAETFVSSGYTRLPLYETSLDNIVGVLYAKDLLQAQIRHQKNEQPVDLRSLARPPFFIPEFQHVDDLLNIFRRRGVHMAIVIDEYSQVVGLITLEDILEELVGDIQDEYDVPDEDIEIIKREDGSWLVDAMTDQEKVRIAIGMPDSQSNHLDYHTLAGMLLAHLGHIPKTGETTIINGFVFEILDMDGLRIDKVLIRHKL